MQKSTQLTEHNLLFSTSAWLQTSSYWRTKTRSCSENLRCFWQMCFFRGLCFHYVIKLTTRSQESRDKVVAPNLKIQNARLAQYTIWLKENYEKFFWDMVVLVHEVDKIYVRVERMQFFGIMREKLFQLDSSYNRWFNLFNATQVHIFTEFRAKIFSLFPRKL